MSKPLSSVPGHARADAIRRRVKSGSLGLGFWAAVDALKQTQFISHDETQALLQQAKKTQESAGIPDNWILRK